MGNGSGTTVVGDAKTQVGQYVTPAALGQTTTMVLRFINEQGRELDWEAPTPAHL